MRPVALGRKNWLHIGSPQADCSCSLSSKRENTISRNSWPCGSASGWSFAVLAPAMREGDTNQDDRQSDGRPDGPDQPQIHCDRKSCSPEDQRRPRVSPNSVRSRQVAAGSAQPDQRHRGQCQEKSVLLIFGSLFSEDCYGAQAVTAESEGQQNGLSCSNPHQVAIQSLEEKSHGSARRCGFISGLKSSVLLPQRLKQWRAQQLHSVFRHHFFHFGLGA
jgi:hypothetical protein